MPPQCPGLCNHPGCLFLAGPSGKCWVYADTAPVPPDLPPADDDTWTVPPVARPARLAPPRPEYVWEDRHGFMTLECHPDDTRRADILSDLGYHPTGQTKGPHIVWAKRLDEGC